MNDRYGTPCILGDATEAEMGNPCEREQQQQQQLLRETKPSLRLEDEVNSKEVTIVTQPTITSVCSKQKKRGRGGGVALSNVVIDVDAWEAVHKRSKQSISGTLMRIASSDPSDSQQSQARAEQPSHSLADFCLVSLDAPVQLPVTPSTLPRRRQATPRGNGITTPTQQQPHERYGSLSPSWLSLSPHRRSLRLSPGQSRCLFQHLNSTETRSFVLEEQEGEEKPAHSRIGNEYQATVLPRVSHEDPTPTMSAGDVLWDPQRAQQAEEQGQHIGTFPFVACVSFSSN